MSPPLAVLGLPNYKDKTAAAAVWYALLLTLVPEEAPALAAPESLPPDMASLTVTKRENRQQWESKFREIVDHAC